MTASPEFIAVGRVKDAHGLKGELFIVLFTGEAAWLKKLKSLRLSPPSGSVAPAIEAAVKAARLHKNGLIVSSPDIVGRTAAEKLRGYELAVPEAFFVSAPGESIFLREIAGFSVFTADAGELGPIVAFSSNGAQDLLVVRTAKGQFQIPFVDAFVKRIDYEAKRIDMEIPAGLLGDDELIDEPGDKPGEGEP